MFATSVKLLKLLVRTSKRRAGSAGPGRFFWWLRYAQLPLLGLLLACQSGGTSPGQGQSAAPLRPAPAPGPGPSFTLAIDDEPQRVDVVNLVMVGAKKGFTLNFEEAGKLKVGVMGGNDAPLAVGKYVILDTAAAVLISGNLPRRPGTQSAQPEEGFLSMVALPIPADAPLGRFVIYDWGEGLRELRGRKLGQFTFTRVGSGTADGSFQSLVYVLVPSDEPKTVLYQGEQRGYLKVTEHTVRGTFTNVPFENYEKSMGDLQKALEAAKGLR